MSQTKNHCEPLVAVWLRPSTTEPCICCKQVAEKPRGEHLKKCMMMYDEEQSAVKISRVSIVLGYAIMTSSNKRETAIHCCHFLGISVAHA